jgi:hypothetical protein
MRIYLELGNEVILPMLESGEMHAESVQKILRHDLELFCVMRPVALWSKIKIYIKP